MLHEVPAFGMVVGHLGSSGPGLQNQPGGSIGMHAGPKGAHVEQTHCVPSLNAHASPTSASVHTAPGPGFSPGHDDPEGRRRAVLDRVAASIPAQRVGTAEEVARSVLYLMQSEFTTGTVLDIDGGHLAG